MSFLNLVAELNKKSNEPVLDKLKGIQIYTRNAPGVQKVTVDNVSVQLNNLFNKKPNFKVEYYIQRTDYDFVQQFGFGLILSSDIDLYSPNIDVHFVCSKRYFSLLDCAKAKPHTTLVFQDKMYEDKLKNGTLVYWHNKTKDQKMIQDIQFYARKDKGNRLSRLLGKLY